MRDSTGDTMTEGISYDISYYLSITCLVSSTISCYKKIDVRRNIMSEFFYLDPEEEEEEQEPTTEELQEIENNPVDTSDAEEVTDDLYG